MGCFLSFIGISRNVNIPHLNQGLIYTLILEYYANNHAVRKDFQAAILPAFQLSKGTAENEWKVKKFYIDNSNLRIFSISKKLIIIPSFIKKYVYQFSSYYH